MPVTTEDRRFAEGCIWSWTRPSIARVCEAFAPRPPVRYGDPQPFSEVSQRLDQVRARLEKLRTDLRTEAAQMTGLGIRLH